MHTKTQRPAFDLRIKIKFEELFPINSKNGDPKFYLNQRIRNVF